MGRTRVTQRTELTVEERAEIWGRYNGGDSITSIAARFERPYSTISSIVNRRAREARTSFKTLSCRLITLKVSIRGERSLLRHASNYPKDTLKTLSTPSKSGHKLCTTTVRKILKNNRKAKRKPRKKPFLRKQNKKKRVRFCKTEKKSKRDWNKLIWSDEVTFVIGEDGSVVYVTRGPREEYFDKNL
jgi:Transposase